MIFWTKFLFHAFQNWQNITNFKAKMSYLHFQSFDFSKTKMFQRLFFRNLDLKFGLFNLVNIDALWNASRLVPIIRSVAISWSSCSYILSRRANNGKPWENHLSCDEISNIQMKSLKDIMWRFWYNVREKNRTFSTRGRSFGANYIYYVTLYMTTIVIDHYIHGLCTDFAVRH